MPIAKEKEWAKCVEINKNDAYSKCCVDVARKVMELLDDDNHKEFEAEPLIIEACHQVEGGDDITGFMAACIAQMVWSYHTRGEEFKAKWNHQYDEKPHDGLINPAILTINTEKKE